jgi:ribosomal protein S18 acetylase RimI-like enzyme
VCITVDSSTAMVVVPARLEDAATILELQKLAYRSEAMIYDDFSISPLTQTLENLQSEFNTKTILKAVADNRIVGSVRAYQKNRTCYVERLIVHPDFQRRGIGTKLLKRIEELFSTALPRSLCSKSLSSRMWLRFSSHSMLRILLPVGYTRNIPIS